MFGKRIKKLEWRLTQLEEELGLAYIGEYGYYQEIKNGRTSELDDLRKQHDRNKKENNG